MKLFSYDGLEIKYRLEGDSGPLLFMLHGFGGGPSDWSGYTLTLSKKYRLIIPNLKVFFSSPKPLSYSKQIHVLQALFGEVASQYGETSVSVMGQSYGATLSLGLALTLQQACGVAIDKHVLFNPMPFQPFEKVRDPYLRVLVNLSFAQNAVGPYLRTDQGKLSLREAAKVFRIGTDGHHEVHNFNDRKLILVEKAVERFRWIDQNENWRMWENKLHEERETLKPFLFYSTQDQLFHSSDYLNIADKVNAEKACAIEHVGHLLIQDCYSQILENWPY